MLKVLIIFGTRPEAIKLAPVIRELQRRSEDSNLKSIICVTAQHRQMLDQVLHLFDIIPDHDLDVMKDKQSPTQVAASVLAQLEPILKIEKPDWVLVQGDTTTVMAASIAAFYAQVKVGHVEAGLRTRNKWQPFPEEINRRIASAVADLHFAPTEQSRQNLLQENVHDDRILVTGNPVIDALNWVADQPMSPDIVELLQRCGEAHGFGPQGTASNGRNGQGVSKLSNSRYNILVTAHRRENFGRPLENICLALRDLTVRFGDQVHIMYPVHLNPNVQEPVYRMLEEVPHITLLPPLDYLSLVHLMKQSQLVLTDSGGLQEEAPGLGVPVLVLRDVTERPEGVAAGTVRLVGTNRDRIVAETVRLLTNPEAYEQMARAANPYGDGFAAARVVSALLEETVIPFQAGR